MGGGPGPHLHVEGTTVVHRLPAHAKLVGLLVLVLTVVALPAAPPWPFAVASLVVLSVVAATRVPARSVLTRAAVELPFVVFAVLLPFVASGPRVEVGPFRLSQAGLTGAWLLLVKGTLGVLAAIAFSTTTSPRDLVRGLRALRVPGPLVQILSFMVRYLGVVGEEMGRMRVARESRGFTARSVRAWPVLAASTGTLFLRSYERGERVHLAMVARGYTGAMPDTDPLRATGPQWGVALLPALVVAVAGLAGRWA
ncbi:MAG TPA: cobalt ECF transporter T component CbiQ [Dermatophilaceae bacterium]|nr:cobalt ECF transporter T component CbiQ [Dermatophilaceae bacterium]